MSKHAKHAEASQPPSPGAQAPACTQELHAPVLLIVNHCSSSILGRGKDVEFRFEVFLELAAFKRQPWHHGRRACVYNDPRKHIDL